MTVAPEITNDWARMAAKLPAAPPSSFWQTLSCPGITGNTRRLRELASELQEELAVFAHKRSQPDDLLWVVFLGGTGTGKSTFFNAVCGQPLSDTGVERPKTFGPILYMHRRAAAGLDYYFPFPDKQIKRIAGDALRSGPYSGMADHFLVLEHGREELEYLVLVDTPDLDSVALHNRETAEKLYLFADAVVFVSSQEKYADRVPYRFLHRIHQDGKLCFLLLNKAEPQLTRTEVLDSYRRQSLPLENSLFWLLPYVSQDPAAALPEHSEFKSFAAAFRGTLTRSGIAELISGEKKRSAREIAAKIGLVLDILQAEQEAARKWLGDLEGLLQRASQALLMQQRQHFTEESRQYLQAEIRRVFGKYDLLAKPRRLVSQVVLSPLQLLGWRREPVPESYQEVIQRLHRKIDLGPIQSALETFNRLVLELLSPKDEAAPLFQRLRRPQVQLTDPEIKDKVWQAQDRVAAWLEDTFRKLARGIPKSTEWGIYSTSIAWGVLVVMLEAVVGGGISLTEALLDSALAPFITKGAVELFAYNELQKIARELADRYQQGLLSVVREQHSRYAETLEQLMTDPQTLKVLQDLQCDMAAAAE
jgi:hypothetical protein